MWFSDATDPLLEKVPVSGFGVAATSLAVIGTLVFGVDPNLFFKVFKFITM